MSKIKVKFITLGCKTNIYESEAMAQLFEEAGYQVTTKGEADVCVINTCTVTGTGAAKSLKMIRRSVRESKDGIIAVTGCLAQTEAEKLLKEEKIDVIIGNKYRKDIVSLCEKARLGEKVCMIEEARNITEYEELGIVHRQRRIRAEIKIEDGCNNFCTYCKIPYARGPVRSRDIEMIKKEAEVLKNDGYSEIVLTGIHIGSYGKDLDGKIGLIDVIEAVCKTAENVRIRLGSLEPVMITEEFVQRAAVLKNLCPQFHLSLQSGCDKTLKAMNRHDTVADFKKAVENLRASFKNCAITTDLIVGFPGETEEDFETSKSFCEEISFAQMHIFPYSVREGTVAAKLSGRVDEKTKTDRTHVMLDSAKAMKKSFCESFIGQEEEVLFEQEKNGVWSGMTSNYIEVYKQSKKDLRGVCEKVIFSEYNEDGEFLVAE